MLRGEWFLALTVALAVLGALRLLARGPLLASRARPLSTAEWAVLVGSTALLVFHCGAMFAPDAVAALGVLDAPAARVRDLSDPVGQAVYWLPALALVGSVRRLWWPAPATLAVTLLVVGWTMYGDFTLTEHLVAIMAAGGDLGLVMAGLVSGGRPAAARDLARAA